MSDTRVGRPPPSKGTPSWRRSRLPSSGRSPPHGPTSQLFDRETFEASLRRQGCPESFVSPIVSDFKLFVPVVLATIGEQELFEIVEDARESLGLNEQRDAWKVAARYIVGWAREQLDEYRREKGLG